jgi:hypothetical protein
VLWDPFESMEVKHALTPDWQLLQIAEKLVGLLAREQLFGGIVKLAADSV